MALLFMDGFSGEDVSYKWDVTSSAYTTLIGATSRVAGCYYGSFSNNPRTIYKTLPASSKIIIGYGVYTNTNQYVTFCGDNGATSHITVVRNSGNGRMEIRRGSDSGTLLATGTTPVFVTTWAYVEISVTISDTVGEVHIRFNGQTTDDVSFTGDTKNGGTATTIDRINYCSGNGSVSTSYVADLYILDSTGATNNDFLGDVAVRTLAASGNGTDSQLTGSDGDSTNNYLLVDEHPFASADYVGSATSGLRDTYTLADLPGGVSTVYGVQVSGLMAKSDVSLGTAKLVIRSGGTLYDGTTRALSTSYVGYYERYTINPATGLAWTVSDVNGLEAGMEVV